MHKLESMTVKAAKGRGLQPQKGELRETLINLMSSLSRAHLASETIAQASDLRHQVQVVEGAAAAAAAPQQKLV